MLSAIKPGRISILASVFAVLLWGSGLAPAAVAQTGVALARFDLTGNNLINAADASHAIDTWMALQRSGGCGAAPATADDVNADGCVDVADVQMVLAHWGQLANPAAPAPNLSLRPEAVTGATFTVNSTGDGGDSNPGDGNCRTSGGDCTLRAAIEEANARPGPETIQFNIRNSDGSCPGVVTLRPGSSLTIDDPRNDGITIDGYTQCGASPNTQRVGGNAQIMIEVEGPSSQTVDGFMVYSSNNVFRGLAVYRWDRQFVLVNGGASNNRFEGNFIGTSADNSFITSSIGADHRQGIFGYRTTYNIFGGTTPAARNIISGNGNYGISFLGAANHNHIIGNYFGLKQDGVTPLPNEDKGVNMDQGVQDTWVGGPNPGEGNVMSGNGQGGMEIAHGAFTSGNHIVGNYFGTDATGTRMIGNGGDNGGNGFSFEDGVTYNEAYNNVVAGSAGSGVYFYLVSSYNRVFNNKIGVGADGATPMPNGTDPNTPLGRNGITIQGDSHNNLVQGNIVANNVENGIVLSNYQTSGIGTNFNTISQNSVYNNGPANPGDPGIGWGILATHNSPNQGILPPTLVGANTAVVSGTAKLSSGAPCAGCTIEVFVADTTDPHGSTSAENYGEGKTFVGTAKTNAAGQFQVGLAGVKAGLLVTATTTDTAGNTSMFARNTVVTQAPPGGGTPQFRVLMPLVRFERRG